MCTVRQYLSVVGAMILMCAPNGFAHAADPALPPGVDPGGTAIALITTGIDYTDPQIASRLARDGEGQLIGWDFVEDDIAPFAADNGATVLAKLLLDTDKRSRLVIVRVDPNNPKHLARASAFIARTPARIAAVPFANENQQTWAFFNQVARKSPRTLFVFSAGEVADITAATPVWPAAAKLPNSIVAAALEPFVSMLLKRSAQFAKLDSRIDAWVVPSGFLVSDEDYPRPPHTSEQAVVMLAAHAACLMRIDPRLRSGRDPRAALLARARPLKGRRKIKVFDPLCW